MALAAFFFFKTRLTVLDLHFRRDAIASKNGEEQKDNISSHHQKNCKLPKNDQKKESKYWYLIADLITFVL